MLRPEPTDDPSLAAVEEFFAGLAPAAPAFSRDRLLYEAGRRSARSGRGWPLAAVVFAGLSAALVVRDATRPDPPTRWVERVVYLPASPPAPAVMPEPPTPSEPTYAPDSLAPAGDYLQLRDLALRHGVDSLPTPPPIRGWLPHAPERAFEPSRAAGPVLSH